LREFSFSENTFCPRPGQEVEFADHAIWIDDLLLLYQLKERARVSSTSPERERRWFQKKVLRDATKQVRDTLRYLEAQPEISITNQRGHTINIKEYSSTRVVKIVVYAADVVLPEDCRQVKHHRSSTGGFIHVVGQRDYLGICETLITPGEVAEYFAFREELISRWNDHVEMPPEAALVGQFLISDDPREEPRKDYYRNLYSLQEDPSEFDLSSIFESFGERIEYTSTVEGDRAILGGARAYYHVLAEFAKLNRTALREIKKRILLSLEAARNNEFQAPYRTSSLSTGCGFLFIPMTKDMVPNRSSGHQNLAYASKYEQRLERQVSASFVYENGDVLTEWMYLDAPWRYDAEMEKRLSENCPFRPAQAQDMKRYDL
jgi:hypothetical protein